MKETAQFIAQQIAYKNGKQLVSFKVIHNSNGWFIEVKGRSLDHANYSELETITEEIT